MIAYNYIVEAREARLRNQSTTKPPQNLTDDQATFQRELIRHKRQSGISGTFANQYNNTLFTIVNSQAASTSAIVYCNANTTSLNFNYNSSTTAYMINVIDAVWYYCLGGMVCAIPSTICQDYTDSYELLQDINNCAMGLTNTIPGFQYPPNNTEANPAAGMAIGVAKYLCTTYANPKCDYGDYAKPENKYNGTYVYKHCTIKSNSTDTIKMSITQCDGSELTTSVAYPSNCTTFMNQFVKDLTDTMAQYDCGKSCKYPNPINQSTTVCGNSYYYDLLSEWAECNLTSSTEFTSTTALTTTELSTIELTTTESTTTELTTTPTTTTKLLTTTVMETTTIEPTTLLTTTEQESTSTTATSTLEFSSSSSTTKIPTSTIESSTTSSSTTTIISTSLSTLLTTSTASMTTTESTSSTSPSTTSSSSN
ncbi:hypothetical protein M3Y96_00903700 [Aphelenchoides besseyi]|nr:hypothetical protein M3Y96_00903700 [Aphelenchoides besseyi]